MYQGSRQGGFGKWEMCINLGNSCSAFVWASVTVTVHAGSFYIWPVGQMQSYPLYQSSYTAVLDSQRL